MEFKRSNSSRGPLVSGRRGTAVGGGVTPKRSTTPLKKASARGTPPPAPSSPAPALPPRAAAPASPCRTRSKATDTSSGVSPQRTASSASTSSPPKTVKNTFERSNSTTGSKGAFKRSNTAAGMRRAEVMKHNNRVNVYVRVRAFRDDEKSGDLGQLAVNMDNDAVEVTVPKKGRFTFGFDGCFWSNDRACPSGKVSSSQEDVFDEVGRPLVENALAGYNAAVMAYGQTGSGKTYTSFGPTGSIGTSQEGLIPRVCNMIFARAANSAQKGVTYTVSASMLEVYLEDVFDLLNHRKQLSVRNDFTNNTFNVVGQKTVLVKSYKDVLALLNKAEPLRTFAATNIHDHSSRAHTLFMLEVQTHFDAPDLAPRCAKILLADLAGCERIKLAGTEEGLAFEQARNINLSLLALGSCIEAVASRGRNSSRPIPEFRNSTLTKLLKDYIGGNSISTMMVTISPSEHDANLSVQTLRFADRAKQITTYAKVNTVDPEQAKQDGSELSDRWRDEYLRKKEALYAEYQLKGTIEKLVTRIADLEDKQRECADDELAVHLTTELEELQKALTEADYQMGLQRQVLYGEFLMLEDELREMNTKMQEMKEEHEEAMEGLLGEEAGRFEEMKRGYEARLRAQQDESDAARTAADDEIAALKRLVAELREKLAAKEAECAALERELAALRTTHERDAAAAAATRGELEEQLEALRAVHEQHVADAAAAEASAATTAAQLREEVAGLRTLHATSEEKACAQVAQLESASAELQRDIAEREEQLAAVEAHLEETEEQVSTLTQQMAAAASAAEQKEAQLLGAVTALQTTVRQLQADMANAVADHADSTAKQRSLQAATEQQLHETKVELQETQAKLTETEGTLAETQAALHKTERALSAEIEALEAQLGVAQTLGQQQGVYIDKIVEYTCATYRTILDGLTEMQVTALSEMLQRSGLIIAAVSDAATAEVDKMTQMCHMMDGNYKETAARFDMLRRILGKIDQDVKEAVVKVDSKEKSGTSSLMRESGGPLGDVSNRENSLERKGTADAQASTTAPRR
ncbi:kinesin [Lotmaria passim]